MNLRSELAQLSRGMTADLTVRGEGKAQAARWWNWGGWCGLVCGLLFGGLGWVFQAQAVPPVPVPLEREAPWRIANFAKDAGVERRMVFDLAFETNNMAWFAVADGLYRYDGYHWRRFTVADGLPSGFIRSVTVTRDGSLWVGTDKGGGVFTGTRFDRRGTEGRLAGPNVRRIVETRDGSLWFCCDRWPDATQPGGLTRLQAGQFRTWGVTNGLPSDHVLTLFEQSNGRLIALTASGPAVWQPDAWQPLVEAGYPTNDHTWAMAETPDGRIYSEAYHATFMLAGDRWRECATVGAGRNAPFCVTRDGAVIKAVSGAGGNGWFARWDGERFTRASGKIDGFGLQMTDVRQAPDGAIWAVGRGTLLRWEYLPGMWEWRPELPTPLFQDRQQRVWFGDNSGTVFLDQGKVETIPDLFPPLVADAADAVWGAGKTGVVRWEQGRLEPVSPERCGIATLQGGKLDASGSVWLYGEDPQGAPVLATPRPTGWKVYGLAAPGGSRISWSAADPREGLWIILGSDKASTWELIKATPDGLVPAQFDGAKPRTHLPRICASRTHLYLYAYNGLWEAPLGERLRFVPAQAELGGVFTRAASAGDITAFLAQEGLDGRAALFLRRPEGWRHHRLNYGEGLWLNADDWLMAADGAEFVLCEVREWATLTHVNLPLNTTIRSMVRASRGDFWLGTSDGVLHLQPGPALPDTVLTGPRSLMEGSAGLFQAIGVAPFTPRAGERRYSFTWRLNDGPWSGYDDWPANGLSLTNLPVGPYRLESRARDGFGNEDPTPAQLAFQVRSLPIQDRRWFRPALALSGLAFALLSLALYSASRRLRRYAGGLEEQVKARTQDLRRDILERQRAEQAEREARRLLRDVLDTVPVRVFWKDRSSRYLGCNLAVAKDAGLSTPEEIIGKTDLELPWREQAEAYHADERQVIETGRAKLGYEEPQTTIGGDRIWRRTSKTPLRDATGKILGVLGTFEDITGHKRAEEERERLQGQLAQAQRMESVGRLAGGVAHDFNNMLQAILGNAALALADLPTDSPQRESLEEIQKSAERSAALTRQLLAFARKQTIVPKVLDLNDTVSGMLKMLRRLMGEHLILLWKPGANLWPVEMDPSQIDQVLANLCLNARDAISGVGQVTLETENVTCDEAQAAELPGLAPGDYVLLAVCDTGCGMDRATLAQIFEPFFTTKDVGQGTGLGLPTVYGIVKQNRGAIQVESEPDHGTTVKIYLPRHADQAVRLSADGPMRPAGRGHETILLVEDEPTVLRVGRRTLESLGYTVLAAASPSAALRLARQHRGPIHLLLTDVVMPEMNGRDLAQQLCVAHPNLKLLFMSGYTADVIANHGVLEEGILFVQKPFTLHGLADKVREALEAT